MHASVLLSNPSRDRDRTRRVGESGISYFSLGLKKRAKREKKRKKGKGKENILAQMRICLEKKEERMIISRTNWTIGHW